MFIKSIKRDKYLLSLRNSYKYCNHLLRQLSDKTNESNEWSISSFTSSQAEETVERVAKRPVSYLPDHLPQNRKRIHQKPWWKYRYFVNINPLDDQKSEWTETPEYPPLKDNTKEGISQQIREEWYSAIKRLPTSEQKEYEICKHYRHFSYIFESIQSQYNALPLQQFITRTHLISGQLPSVYDQMNVESILDNDLKQLIIDSIALHLFETKQRKPSFEMKISHIPSIGFLNDELRVDAAKQEDTIEDVIAIIRKSLHSKCQHLERMQMDLSPSVCNSWWHKDFPTPFTKKSWFQKETLDQQFTYRSTHSLHLRTEKPLPPVISLEDDICMKSVIPEYKYRLLQFGYPLFRHSFTSIAGFWSDHSNGFDFPNLICHSRQDLKLRERKNGRSFGDDQQVLDGMAIMSSFAWLNSLSSNLGFTIYHELTYPLVTHVVITDGQFWSFYVYQLNTHCFHSDVDNGLFRNVCWSSGDLKLFDTYENGRLIGVNEEVLKILIKFLVRSPQMTDNCNLRPYLSEDTRSEDDIKHMSYLLKRKHSHFVDSWLQARQEVQLWEKIYKYHKESSPTPHIRTRPKIVLKYPPFFKR